MPTLKMRVLLFLSSYFPLFLIVGILFFARSLWIAGGAVIAGGLLCVEELWRYLRDCRRGLQESSAKVKDYQRRDSEAMSYIASYLIPFATFSLDFIWQLLALIVFVVMLLIIYVNSNMIYVNPMLNFLGYHLYEIEIEHSQHSYYYIARKRLIRDDVIHYVSISDETLLEKT